MTKVIYNNITMKDVLTHSVDFTPEYEQAGVDPIYLRVTLTVETIINLADGDLGVSGISSNIVTTAREVIGRLSMPRRRLRLVVGDRKLLDITPSNTEPHLVPARGASEVDINNGPKPEVTIRDIISDSTMRITFKVTSWIPVCDSGNMRNITNLRWWTSDSIDENWYTTRTVTGRLQVATHNTSVHEFRKFVLPPLQGGFKRKTIDLTEDPSGLALDFRIVDQQEYAAPPFPATKWTGSFTASQPFVGDLTSTLECRVHVEGPPDVSRADLINVCASIIASKLFLTKKFKGTNDAIVPESLVFTEHLHKNAVDGVGRVRAVSKKPILARIAAEAMGKNLQASVALDGNYDPLTFPRTKDLTAGLRGIFLAALQNTCHPDTDGLAGNQAKAQKAPITRGQRPKITYRQGVVPKDNVKDKEDDSHKKHPYTETRMTSVLKNVTGKTALPIGEAADDDDSGDSMKVVETHIAATMREITVELERYEVPPEVPKPVAEFNDANGIKHTLIQTDIESDAPKLLGNHEKLYYFRMKLIYALSRAPDFDKDKVPMGRLPYIGTQHGDETISFKFTQGIIK